MTVAESVAEKLKAVRAEIAQREGKIQQHRAVVQTLFELANPIGGGAAQK